MRGPAPLRTGHRYGSPANRTSILNLGPMAQTLTVKHMLVGTRQNINLLSHSHTHIANSAVSPSIGDLTFLGLPPIQIDKAIALHILGTAAAVKDQAEADQRRQRDGHTGDY